MMDKISLAGDLGSGKSTVSKLLVESLGAEYYSTGAIVRQVAAKRGMTVGELNKYMETHPELDHEIDHGLEELSDVDKLLIIDSRMAWHFTRGTFKVYMTVDLETSAARILAALRPEERSSTLEEAMASTKARRDSEKKRYLDQYGVDIKDLTNYSFIVDTTAATPEEVALAISDGFSKWQRDKSYKMALICPERLHYPDREPDFELMSRYSTSLELGEDVGDITVIERDGEFYISEGLEAALAYAHSMSTYVPARLIKGEISGEYVRMKNSL
jgi:predicted cytidylate kinase